jgi:hypothetical protein
LALREPAARGLPEKFPRPISAKGGTGHSGNPDAQLSLVRASPPCIPRETVMQKLMFGLILAGLPLVLACDQSVSQNAEDVREAQENAGRVMEEERRDVQDAVKAGQDEVIEQQRELEDAARKEQEKINQEKRELEDAQRKEAEKEAEKEKDADRDGDGTPDRVENP